MSNLDKVLGVLVDMRGAEDMLDVAEALEAAGLLAPDKQVIRTVEEFSKSGISTSTI